MIRLGNSKLGKTIWHWSIPALTTCPGSTPTCILSCYALKGRYYLPDVARGLEVNFVRTTQPDFADWLISQMIAFGVRLLRLHPSGDFYSEQYVRDWLQVTRRCRSTTFFAYTRSWRDQKLLPLLEEMAALPNMFLFWSEDRDTGPAPDSPHALRCYLAVDDNDVPTSRPHLVFRDKPQTTRKKMGGSLICPHEQLQPYKPACDRCRLCFTQSGWGHLRRQAQQQSCPPQLALEAPPG